MGDNNYQKKSEFTKEESKKLLNKDWRMNHLYYIKDREDKIVQFKQNAAQRDYYGKKHTRNIILKSRRLGFSTEICNEFLDAALFSNADALIVAHKEDDMKKLFKEKVKRAWEHFPFQHWLNVITNNKTMMEFDRGQTKDGKHNKSSISVSLSGRSGGYNKMHISEFGKICAKFPQKAKEIISGSIPAVPENGEVVIESTAEGRGGYFYNYFWKAWERQQAHLENNEDLSNLNLRNKQWKAFFYSWRWDKEEIKKTTQGRDPIPLEQMNNKKFFKEQQIQHGLTPRELTYYYLQYETLGEDMELLLREYPTTPEEAFDAGEESWFDSTKVKKQMEYTTDYEVQNSWKVFEEPSPTHTYAIGVDPSSGEGGDHTAATIWDFSTLRPTVVATFQSNRIKPDVMAHKLKQAGIRYNTALIAVEQGRFGYGMLTSLKATNYPITQIFKEVDQRKQEDRQTDKLGWPTNKATKPKMFSEFSTAINEDIIRIRDEQIIDEALSYPQDEVSRTRRKKDDSQSRHWDLLTSTVIGYQMKDYVKHTNQAKTIRLKQNQQIKQATPTSGKHAAI